MAKDMEIRRETTSRWFLTVSSFFLLTFCFAGLLVFNLFQVWKLQQDVFELREKCYLVNAEDKTNEGRHRRQVSVDPTTVAFVQQYVKSQLDSKCSNNSIVCTAGTKGDPGIPGIKGDSGVKGDKGDATLGPAGPKGEKGDVGVNGSKGDMGFMGLQGLKGDKGEEGAQGIQGILGPQGLKGEEGSNGTLGPAGLKGDTGIQGNKGDIGPNGLKGFPGDKGERGSPGLDGPFGPTGAKGDQGPQGTQGPKGDAGPTGVPGIKGATGEKGQSGAAGPTGLTGAKGVPGQNGGKGEPGTQGAKGKPGSAGPFGPSGPKGEVGSPGAQGPSGYKGEKGDQGTTGSAGLNGQKGNTGLTGPQGPVGAKGEAGAKGDTGRMGPQGLAGQFGQKGDMGPQGAMGQKGQPGQMGYPGLQGPQGQIGQTGVMGPKGERGPQGYFGQKGEKGDSGPSTNCCNSLAKPAIQGGTTTYHVSAEENNTVILPCKVSGYPVPLITWSRDNGVSVIGRGVLTTNGLVISNVKVSDSGKYTCHAESSIGSLEKVVELNVTDGKPKIFPQKQFVGVQLGQVAENLCVVTQADRYNLQYIKVSGTLPVHNIKPDGSLTFVLTKETDSGEYQCKATAAAGSVTAAFYVYKEMGLLTCYTTFADCSKDDKAMCGGDCPAGCTDLNENYHAHRFALNLPVCRASLNSGELTTAGGHVVWKNEHANGGEAAEFVKHTDRKQPQVLTSLVGR